VTAQRRRVVIYARVSSPAKGVRADDHDQDPAVQVEAMREWVQTRGWQVVAVETDRVTGDLDRRKGDPPGLRRALTLVQDRKADVLGVFAADRIVRHPVGLLQLVSRVQSLGGHVASMQDGSDLDTTTPTGELLTFLRGWWARMELRLIRERTRAGLARARAEGKKLGRPLSTSAPEPAQVAQLRHTGASWAQVADRLHCCPSAARRALMRLVGNGGSKEPIPPVESGAADPAPPKSSVSDKAEVGPGDQRRLGQPANHGAEP
jgi:DNA invertase Pin-like site-specific DNA recombinase